MKKSMIITLILFLLSSCVFGQLTKISRPNMVSEADIYKDEQGVRYSNLVNVKFSQNVIELSKGETVAELKELKIQEVKDAFAQLV